MKITQIFSKTTKDVKNYESKNAKLLIQAGYIDQTMAGVYTFLPLGWRVLSKIERIVREEMDTIGAEIFMPAIAPKSVWEDTGRLETIDVLMKTVGANAVSLAKNDAEYVLNCTHEDVVTPIAAKFNRSYKDFPFAIYQIQSKFRNEPRAKSGLLRCREFRMKDLYSFHTSHAEFQKYYDDAKEVYKRVYKRVGIGDRTYLTLASGGDFTDDHSHEFQTVCDTGEDIVFHAKQAGVTYNREIAPSKAPYHGDVSEKKLSRKDVEGVGIVGVAELASYLDIPVEKTTKTILFETDGGDVIAAAVRGDYDINEEKLRNALGVKSMKLASAQTVKRITGAEVGYAGVLDLPEDVRVIMDDSMKGRVNWECGANKTNYHSININFGTDLDEPEEFYDIKVAREGDLHPESGEVYEVLKTSEVGNIFPLGSKFPRAIGYTFTDEEGKEQDIIMGSYGIGTSRLMGVIAEVFADEKGLVWPADIAPFTVHLISLPGGEEKAEAVYASLQEKGIEVLWDDRDVSAGAKFADCDLIGIPWRFVISKKTGEKIEIKKRTERDVRLVSKDEAIAVI